MRSELFSVIVLDLDGTLLTDTKKISSMNIETLIKAQKQGHKLVIATGRGNMVMEHYAKKLKIDKYGGYVISFNGQRVHEWESGVIYKQAMIKTHIVQAVYGFAKKHNLQLIAEDVDRFLIYTPEAVRWHYNKVKLFRFRDRVLKRPRQQYPFFNSEGVKNFVPYEYIDSFKPIDREIPKLVLSQAPEIIDIHLTNVIKMFEDELSIMQVEPTWVDIAPKSVNKHKGLQWVSERLDVPLSRFIAFGDSENDVEMLQHVGTSYAMKNAMPAAKAVADHITTHTNNEDGVSIELEKLLKV